MFKFWPFPLLRNYGTSHDLSKLFMEFAEAPDLHICRQEPHHIVVACSKGELRFWSANRYYAWANEGSLTAAGKTIAWRDEMPSRYAMRAMRKAIELKRSALPSTDKDAA